MIDLEQLAALLDTHHLSRVEYEKDNERVVLERIICNTTVVSPDPSAVTASTATMLANPLASVQPQADAPTAQVSAPGASQGTPVSANTILEGTVVKAPLVGVVYRSKEPGAAPFVVEGQEVQEGTVLCLIEAMKAYYDISAPCAGTIKAIHFEDAALAEHNAPLFTIG